MMMVNLTRDVVLANDVRRAANPWSRLVGLLGRAALASGEGLHITPCSGVHTVFMRFPIDVLFLDQDGQVVRLATDVGPFRFVWGRRRAHSALELPAGTVAVTRTEVGDHIASR